MTLNEWLTLAGLVISPIAAVLISLWIEGRRRKHDGKMQVVRALIMTRHLPADADYSRAINLLRVEFADCPAVMAAFAAYQNVIRREQPATPEGQTMFNADIIAAQTKLLSAALQAVGIKASEADLAVEAYAATGFVRRDNLYLESLAAQIRIANALERSVPIATEGSVGERLIAPPAV